jgi:predicted short-subunit dehydrogenase-like oxidoreductase (DUF2520 family)
MTEFARPQTGTPSSAAPGASEIAIVGAGRVGCSIGRGLAARGHRIVAASTFTPASASRVRDLLGDVPVTAPEDAALAADIVVLAVPDDVLAATVERVAAGMRAEATVVHTCGLHGAAILEPCGERVAAIHPAQAVPSGDADLTGVWFGVTCAPPMLPWSDWFVAQLGGLPLHISEDARPLYHAALVMASNFTVALAGDAQDLLGERAVLGPLMRQTVANIEALGADAALTGPVVRGDVGTVRAHLIALPPHLLESYVANARRALDHAVRSGRLDAAKAHEVANALEGALVR